MGNLTSSGRNGSRGRIVHWDGSVQEFDKPVTVAELMLEHPQQLVVEFHSAFNQRRPSPLPADQTLQTNKIYLMLPLRRGKPLGLNAQDSRRFLLILNSKSLLPRSSRRFIPWLARMCHHPHAVEAAHVTPKKPQISENEETAEMCRDVFPEIIERPEYLSRELSGKGWKPSLDTITEKKIETKISHWLFFKAF